jgi:cell division protein FtsL
MDQIYYVKPVDNSRWVPAPNPRERQYYLALILAGGLLLGAGMFFAHERFQSREYGYRIESMERDKSALLESNRKLQLEEASLVDPLRIDSIARNELGMATLAPQQIYRDTTPEPGATVVAERRTPESLLTSAGRRVAAALP